MGLPVELPVYSTLILNLITINIGCVLRYLPAPFLSVRPSISWPPPLSSSCLRTVCRPAWWVGAQVVICVYER